MALLHRFCFWFSVRLGSIIIGILTMIQSCLWMMLSVLAFENIEHTSAHANHVLEDLQIKNEFAERIANNPQPILVVATVYFAALLLSSLLTIIGALQCKHLFLYPFICLFGVYILFLLVQHVLLMMHFKKDDMGLGILIMLCNFGGFLILYFLYMWGCVISLLQIIKELREEMDKKAEFLKYFQSKNTMLVSKRHF